MLGSLCQISRIPFDPALVAQQHPPPHSTGTFVEAATALGFKVGSCNTGGRKPSELTFPFVAWLRDDAAVSATTSAAASAPAAGLALVVKADDERLMYFRVQSNAAETMPSAEFAQHFEPVALLVTHHASPQSPDDYLWSRDADQFGFCWFIPELLKHKTIWRSVLLASFVMQLVGLTTLLFIAHNLPHNLQVDAVFDFGAASASGA